MERAPDTRRPLILSNLFLPNLATVAWEPFRSGIEIHRLYAVEDGPSAALLRYAPGASLTRHVHGGYEHILVLQGSQIDDHGEHKAGTLLVHPPESSHAIQSPTGCIALAIWERAVRFVEEEN